MQLYRSLIAHVATPLVPANLLVSVKLLRSGYTDALGCINSLMALAHVRSNTMKRDEAKN